MKKMTIIASIVALASAAAIATFALGGGPKIIPVFEAKATGKSFVFAAGTGSQFQNTTAHDQEVKVETGSTDPIQTIFIPREISSLAFGQNGRFVEAHPIADKLPHYSLTIGINNLTHFEIDMGVENDGPGDGDWYDIELLDEDGFAVESWESRFEPDGDGDDYVHIEWYKGVNDRTVVEVLINLEFENDSANTNLYIESMTLSWNC